ncbi:hypothetical protein FRX31_027869 [Thalictrum thalictroides]|uniref:Uncharacterized protein n=1 Tax=Thalictrum thalictroides TaxID=46969 RepID=A0A7J6VBS6_THATH|nr:hypothetical protein FRX31_027869 [Thalictrum thalictroides]
MTVQAAAAVVARTISYLQLSFSHSSPIGSSQHLSSFLTFSTRRRPTPSFSVIISKPTHFMSSLFSPISFPMFRVPIPFLTVSYHALQVRGIISPSSSTLPIPYQSSAVLNYFTDSNSTSRDWTPPIRVPCLLDPMTFCTDEPDYSRNRWLISMDTYGFEFETEEALFNYYIKALAAVVGR